MKTRTKASMNRALPKVKRGTHSAYAITGWLKKVIIEEPVIAAKVRVR